MSTYVECPECETEVDFDIEDYFEDIFDSDIINMVCERGLAEQLISNLVPNTGKIQAIKQILGLKSYHDKERVMKELEFLF